MLYVLKNYTKGGGGGQSGRFFVLISITLKVDDLHISHLSEPYNPLQEFSPKKILFNEMGIFRFLIHMGFSTLQHMMLGFTWLLLRMQDHIFSKTLHIYVLQNMSDPSFIACYFTLKKCMISCFR